MPIAVSDNYATVAHAGKIYVFGGVTNVTVTDANQIYDIAGDSWSLGTPMPTARGANMAGVIGGRIAVFGGVDIGFSNTDVTEIYDPATDSWSAGPPMPSPASEIAQGMTWDASGVYSVGQGRGGFSGPGVFRLTSVTSTVKWPFAHLTCYQIRDERFEMQMLDNRTDLEANTIDRRPLFDVQVIRPFQPRWVDTLNQFDDFQVDGCECQCDCPDPASVGAKQGGSGCTETASGVSKNGVLCDCFPASGVSKNGNNNHICHELLGRVRHPRRSETLCVPSTKEELNDF